jgi:hypothetical protein
MAYRPPVLRQPKTDEDKIAELQTLPDVHFPSLGKTASLGKSSLSYADKAREWKERKEEIEMNERIEAELKIQREERARRKQEEEDYLRSTFAVRREVVEAPKEEIIEQPKVESEWTLVQRKPRKEKKNIVNYDDEPLPEFDAEDQEFNDRESLW